ncbi:MAG: hypothetical protein QXN63_00780 [Candidatus Bathyarchaeia archaeon]
MRTDFAFYVVAAVWFIVALYFVYVPQVANPVVAVFSVVVGICFIGAGLMQRHKSAQMVSIATAIPTEKQTRNPQLEATVQPKTVEAKVEPPSEEKTSARRVTRRRRKKSG